ncbi:MAG: hypothetical protein AABM29_10975 [Actinomycetota bacterium]
MSYRVHCDWCGRWIKPDDDQAVMYVEVHRKRTTKHEKWSKEVKTTRHFCVRRRVLEPAAKTAGVEWLGHADPGFTLRTYVHLLDEGVGDAAFMDAVVGTGERRNAGVDQVVSRGRHSLRA